jgi:hypothetical protein
VRVVLEPAKIGRALEDLRQRDEAAAAAAQEATEWLTLGEDEDEPLVLTRRRLQLFLWYELPRKRLMPPEDLLHVAGALAELLDLAGPRAAAFAALCRRAETERLIRTDGEDSFELIDSSGLEPPDTELLEWRDLMSMEEAQEREAAAVFLEEAIDRGDLDPRAKDWRKTQRELLDGYLTTPSDGGDTPLDRIHASRIEDWLGPPGVPDGFGGERRSTLERLLPLLDEPEPMQPEAAAAIEPLLWLLGLLADGMPLTQTNALQRSLVRAAVERYPDWWLTELVGSPHREADVIALETLHSLALAIKLARRRRRTLHITPHGRALRDDPAQLFRLVVRELASAGEMFPPSFLDVGLAMLLTQTEATTEEPDILAPVLLVMGFNRLLSPFAGVNGSPLDAVSLNPAGRTLAIGILRACTTGPRHPLF